MRLFVRFVSYQVAHVEALSVAEHLVSRERRLLSRERSEPTIRPATLDRVWFTFQLKLFEATVDLRQ